MQRKKKGPGEVLLAVFFMTVEHNWYNETWWNQSLTRSRTTVVDLKSKLRVTELKSPKLRNVFFTTPKFIQSTK